MLLTHVLRDQTVPGSVEHFPVLLVTQSVRLTTKRQDAENKFKKCSTESFENEGELFQS